MIKVYLPISLLIQREQRLYVLFTIVLFIIGSIINIFYNGSWHSTLVELYLIWYSHCFSFFFLVSGGLLFSIEKVLGGLSLWRRESRVAAVVVRVIAGQAFRKFLPLFDGVLVQRSAAETVTKGGIMLSEKSWGQILQAAVVAIGSGSKGKGGKI